MPALSPQMQRVVTRRRIEHLGGFRPAAEASGVSPGTWQRVESGKNFEYPSLVKIVIALGWDSSAADLLLDGRDPGAAGAYVDHTSGTDLNSRIARLDPEDQRYIDGLVDAFERKKRRG